MLGSKIKMRIYFVALLFLLLPKFAAFGQVTRPLIDSTFPSNGATDVSRNTAIVVRLNSTTLYSLQMTLKRSGVPTNIAVTELSSFTDNLTFADRAWRTAAALEANTRYDVALSSDTPTPFHQFQFTTGSASDTTPPRLVSITPPPDRAAVDPFAPLAFTFDEPLLQAPFSQSVILRNANRQEVGQGIAVLRSDRRTIEVRPQWRGVLSATMEIEFPVAQVKDLAGNAASSAITTFRWPTLIADATTAPRVLGQYPKADETGVPTDAAVQILLDQPVDTGTARAVFSGAAIGFSQLSVNKNTLIFSGMNFAPNTRYGVRITGVRNSAGQELPGDVAFAFTTGGGPEPGVAVGIASSPSSMSPPTPTNAKFVVRSPKRFPDFAPLLFATLDIPRSSGGYTSPRARASAILTDEQHTLVVMPDQPLPPLTAFSLQNTVADVTGTVLRQTDSLWGHRAGAR